MIWGLTFSQALAVFAIALTPIYLVLLILSEKGRSARGKRCSVDRSIARSRLNIMIIAVLFLMETLTILLLHLPGFKETMTYSGLLLFITGLLLCALRSSRGSKRLQMLVLASAILAHFAFVYSPSFGPSIHERAAAIARLTLEGYWDPSLFSARSVYNPVPMDLGLLGTLCMITSISTIDRIKDIVVLLVCMVTYDVLLYRLTKRATHSQAAGILAILVLAMTPPANFTSHTMKWIASLLVLASAIALIKALDGLSSIANIVFANLSYVAAVLFHPSAAIGGFLPLGIVAASYVAKKGLEDKTWERLSKSGLLRATAALFITITFARAIYTAGYLEAVVPSLHSFLSTAFGYATPQESFIPIYDQSVSPINALAWAMPVAMASAIALYSVLKRKALGGNFALTMSFLAVAFIFLGYLSAAFKAGGFQGAMYPAFAFLIPSAAALGVRVLRSSKTLAGILLVSVAVCAGIASTDPTLSTERYRETGAGDVDTKVGDYITAVFLTDRIPSSRCLFMPYEIASSFEYLTVAANASPHPRYTSSADIERIEVDRVVTDKELLPDMIYIWPERWLPNVNSHLDNSSVNIYFDSTRHVVFERSQGDR